MKISAKITSFLLCLLTVFTFFPSSAHAQSALDAIKSRLESEGISVVDYSTPEGKWGSLNSDWISYLSGKNFSSLQDFITKKGLDTYFTGSDGLIGLRRDLARLISEKSQLTDQSAINSKNLEILNLMGTPEKPGLIQVKEVDAKKAIGDAAGKSDTASKELLFREVDFYFTYQRWGALPDRIIQILEPDYISLQDVIDQAGGADSVAEALKGTPNLSDDDIELILDSYQILAASGERQVGDIARSVVNVMKNLAAGLAVLWIVYAGARMIFAQGEESVINEQKRAIFYGILGLAAILLVGRGIDFLYGPAGVTRTTLTRDAGFSAEVYGIISFIRALIGMIAILFIIISGIRMVFAAGEEGEITKQKTALLWIGVGLILVAINEVIVNNIFITPTQAQSDQIRSSNVTAIINTLGTVLKFVLGFVGLVAFGILVYGAANMIANYGDEEMVSKAKKTIKNALIGIMVIISAYTIVATLVVFR